MKKERLKSLLFTIAFVFGFALFFFPTKAQASWDCDYGTVTVWHLDSDFVDGKYRFNVKFKFEQKSYNAWLENGLKIENIKLTNSSGKSVATWNPCTILKKGGTITKHFSIDFTKYPTDTYKFCYSITPECTSVTKNYNITVKHTGGKITYSSAKYEYATDGAKSLKITFNLKNLKGYKPTLSIYDSNNKLIRTITASSALSSNDTGYYFKWAMTDSKGNKVPAGTYTFKVTANGKSATKNVTIQP